MDDFELQQDKHMEMGYALQMKQEHDRQPKWATLSQECENDMNAFGSQEMNKRDKKAESKGLAGRVLTNIAENADGEVGSSGDSPK
jgi:hypothetical protein